eukprot:GSChrysophyteH1.ASY1.ANO1.2838.1 assembled CDS
MSQFKAIGVTGHMHGAGYFIGVDLGTSGMRVLLVDSSSAIVGSTSSSYAVESGGGEGWSEQSPGLWIAALKKALKELREQYSAQMAQVKAMGVTGHMHGAVCLDADGNVLRKCILWNDTRSFSQAAFLDSQANARDICGNIIFPGFTAPKLLWLKEHEKETFEKIKMVLLPASYINYWLSGQCTMDYSDASGTAWLDLGKRKWSEELLRASGMTMDRMPKLVHGCDVIGQISAFAHNELHGALSCDVRVVAGSGDNAASACGISSLKENESFVSLGTSGVILVNRQSYNPLTESAVHTFAHSVPNRWFQMGVMLACTDSLNWFVDDSIAKLQYFPYISGERTPHNDAHIRGAFVGIGVDSDRSAMTRAVIEGISFSLRDSFEALLKTGAQINSLTAIGGGTASSYFLKTLATVLNIPIKLPVSGVAVNAAAQGAAKLAMIGHSDGISLTSESCLTEILQAPAIDYTVQPESDSAVRDAYEKAYEAFRLKYKNLKSLQD